MSRVVDTGGLKLISRATGVPAIDLAALTLELRILETLAEDVARGRQILPVRLDDQRLFVAMERPDDESTIDELAFISGRKVIAYAAHPEQLRATIEAVYLARKRGLAVWNGPRVPGEAPGSIDAAIRHASGTPPPVRTEPFAAEVSYEGETTPVPRTGTRPLVLVVDDEPVIRRLMQDGLSQRGYEVMTAGGGGETFRLVKQREPDAILLDAMLPDVHGFDICKRLKASRRYRHIPIIMVTALYKGWRMAADLKEAYGVHATVEKPFDIHVLARTLEEALAGRPVERPSADVLSAEAQRLYKDSASAYRIGDLDSAVTALAAAVAIDPLSATLRHQLGLLHAQRGQDFAAIQELEAAVDLEPTRFQTLRNLAVIYQKHGFRRKSCEVWERALASAPDEPTRQEIRNILLKLL